MDTLQVRDESTSWTTQNLNLGKLSNQILEEENISDLGLVNGGFEQATTIHIENSSDVVIGPVTQFHGPVTIVNRSDVPILTNGLTLENISDPRQNTSINQGVSPTKLEVKGCLSRTWKFMLIATAVLLFTLGMVAISLNTTEIEISIEPNETQKYISRELWGGKPPVAIKPLLHPIPYVLITHTVTPYCKTLQECSEIVRNIQSDHIDKGYSDIGSNFLIGGDGNIYVGRGWDAMNYHIDKCVSIAFIGDYRSDVLTAGQINVTQMLLENGVRLKKLDVNYKLVNHNQIYATLSPGKNVYEETMKWPHFKPGTGLVLS